MKSIRDATAGKCFLPTSGIHIENFSAFIAAKMGMRFQIRVKSHSCRVVAWNHADESMLAKETERIVDRRKRQCRNLFPEFLVNRIGKRMPVIRLDILQDCNPLRGSRNTALHQKGVKRLTVRFHVCVGFGLRKKKKKPAGASAWNGPADGLFRLFPVGGKQQKQKHLRTSAGEDRQSPCRGGLRPWPFHERCRGRRRNQVP